ncbi:MAG: hypothetical protein AAF493_16730 [Pseudomonadota bacterium]
MGSAKSTASPPPVPWRRFVEGYEHTTATLQADSGPPFEAIWASAEAVFSDDLAMAKAFALRFWALLDLVRRDKLDTWVTRNESGQPAQLHPATVLAAAEVRMTKRSRFPANRFVARVEEIIANEG